MAKPVEWLGDYQVNQFGEATGVQSDPRIVGLANGNFLVAWTEAADGTVAGDKAGTDIVAKIYDAEGTLVRNAYRLNVESLNDEGDFDIAATSDGGFVLVYLEDETAIQGNSATSIHWNKFSASGNSTHGELLASEILPDSFLANPQVTVDLGLNQSIVTFTRDTGPDTDVRGITVGKTGFVGVEFDAANNSADFDGNGDVAILANGDIVSVYEEEDGAVRGIEFKIFDDAGGVVAVPFNVSSGENRSPKVATLLNGNFVVVYHASDSENGNIEFQIFGPTGNSIAGPFNAANGADDQNEPNVVALPDGDFLIAWDNETDGTLEARRLNSDGTLDATTFTVLDKNVAEIDVGVTGDGRVLFTWRDGEIFASIWDPRGAVITVADYQLNTDNFLSTNVVTSGVTSSTVIGNGRGDTYSLGITLGQGGDDLLSGEQVTGTIEGGGGDDTIISFMGEDVLDGESGIDTLDYSGSLEAVDVLINALGLFNHGGDAENDELAGFEIMIGSDFDDSLDANGFDTTLKGGLGDDLLEGISGDQNMLGGDGNDTIIATGVLKGERGDDSLTGSSGDDTIFAGVEADIARGGSGGDSIQGGGGGDTLFGENGDDTVYGDDATPTAVLGDSIDGGAGNDLLFGAQGDDTIGGGVDSDTIAGFGGADALDGGGFAQDFIVDTVDYSASAAAVDVLLNSATNSGGDAEGDLLSGFEAVIGSAFNDTLDANNFGFFTLQGGLGNDLLIAGDNAEVGFARTLDGGGGKDTLLGGIRDDNLLGGGGADSLAGGSGIDLLSGGGSDDTLAGGRSGDTLDGGDGIDLADYSGAEDKVVVDLKTAVNGGEAFGDVFTSIENVLGSAFNDLLKGDDAANSIDGSLKSDNLSGRDGDDTLTGGIGQDTLKGGAGADQFRLTTLAVDEPDRIQDFAKGEDIIALDAATFGLPAGALDPSRFVVSNKAQDADDNFVYKADVGKLFYDPDGNGAAAQIQIATIINLAAIDAGDFVVI